MGRRLAYGLLGCSIGAAMALVLEVVFGKHSAMASSGIVVACGLLAVSIAERRGKVKSSEELNRLVTLFPRTSNNTPDEEKSK